MIDAFDRTFIRCKELYAEIFSHKMTNEMQEMFDLKILSKIMDVVMSVPNLIEFSLCVCYKCYGFEKNREDLLELLSFFLEWVWSDVQKVDSCYRYVFLLLMLEVFDNSEKWKSFYYKIYCRLVSNKVKLIEHEIKARKIAFERMISFGDHLRGFVYSIRTASLLGSGNLSIMAIFETISQSILDFGGLVGTKNESEKPFKIFGC